MSKYSKAIQSGFYLSLSIFLAILGFEYTNKIYAYIDNFQQAIDRVIKFWIRFTCFALCLKFYLKMIDSDKLSSGRVGKNLTLIFRSLTTMVVTGIFDFVVFGNLPNYYEILGAFLVIIGLFLINLALTRMSNKAYKFKSFIANMDLDEVADHEYGTDNLMFYHGKIYNKKTGKFLSNEKTIAIFEKVIELNHHKIENETSLATLNRGYTTGINIDENYPGKNPQKNSKKVFFSNKKLAKLE